MSKVTPDDGYVQLRSRVAQTLSSGQERARKAVDRQQLLSYHEVGRLIHTYLLGQENRARYGDKLVAHLAADVGFYRQRVYDMLKLFRLFPIVQPVGQLGWGHYQLLLTVPDSEQREGLRELAEAQGMTKVVLGEAIRRARGRGQKAEEAPQGLPAVKRMMAKRGQLYTYRVVASASGGAPRLDLGFGIYLSAHSVGLHSPTPGTMVEAVRDPSNHGEEAAYTFREVTEQATRFYSYLARVEKVIDGDTLWLDVDCGFGVWSRQKVRLRGIDAPELGTAEGEEAKAYVEEAMESGRWLREDGK